MQQPVHPIVATWNRLLIHTRPSIPEIKTASVASSAFQGEFTPLAVWKVRITLDPDHGMAPLVNDLDTYIQADPQRIDAALLRLAKSALKHRLAPNPIKTEGEAADRFTQFVATPVQLLAAALRIESPTLETTDILHGVIPDRVFKVDGRSALIVEYKNPTCGNAHFQSLVDTVAASPEGIELNLLRRDTTSTSILAKVRRCGL